MFSLFNSNVNDLSVNKAKNHLFKYLDQARNWLFPNACILCGAAGEPPLDLCSACFAELPWLNTFCLYCALPLPITTTPQICGACLQTPPPFAKTRALFSYQNPIDKLITGLKFHHKLVYAKLLAELFAKQLTCILAEDTSLPDCIIPVPLHPSRLRERGFNQAVEIIRPVARKFKIPLDLVSCHRIRATKAQTELAANQRHANIKNAFAVSKKLTRLKHVVVFDDVVTTGNTARELSKTLRQNGVERIDVWCCARTNS